MKAVHIIAKLLVIIGALNWGLIGFFGYDLVASLFGGMMTTGARVVYGLVGLAGLFKLCKFFMRCCGCGCGCGCSGCKCGGSSHCGNGSCSSKKNDWKNQ